MDDPGKRSEPTLDVLPDDVVEPPPVERREPTLDRLLDELEAEVRPASQPPRDSAPATLPPRAPARPPPPPPSPPRGLGRPVVPLPRALKTTAPGIAAPPSHASLAEDDEVRERARQWAEEIERAPDGPRKGLSCFELGRLHEGLGDATHAAACYQRAIANRPDHLPSLRAARRLALARGDHRAACTLLDAEARITADPRRKASLLYTKGRILEDVLGQPREARELYGTAAELDRANVSFLIALEQRCREDGDGAALGPLYERMAQAVVADPRHRAALLVERARLLEHAEKRVDAALEAYELALSLDPRASGALDGIERLAAAHGRTRERIRCLERRSVPWRSTRWGACTPSASGAVTRRSRPSSGRARSGPTSRGCSRSWPRSTSRPIGSRRSSRC
jgi:tetratricopeptide (TPR) repeat protein